MRESVKKTERVPTVPSVNWSTSFRHRLESEAHEISQYAMRRSDNRVDGDSMKRGKSPDGPSSGQPLQTSARAFMEPRFGWDFSSVRIHTDTHAAEETDALSARAFTHGSDIYFSRGSFTPDTDSGKYLLAHELAHVVQQSGGAQPAVQRQPAAAAPPKGETVKLGGGTHKIKKGDTLATIAQSVYGDVSFWPKIKAANPARVHGPTNAIIVGEELTLPQLDIGTLAAMQGLERHAEQLRDLAKAMTEDEYQAFIKGLPSQEKEKNAVLLQIVAMMRATGMTFDQMAIAQKKFIEDEAKTKGVSVGDYVKDLIATKGYGGGTAKDWNKLTDAEKKSWRARFDKIVKDLEKSPPADIASIITMAKKKGGGFEWNPAETEENGAFAYTDHDWKLHCGTRFVEQAEKGLSIVYPSIAHEMGGHNFYGSRTFGEEIQEGALDKIPKAEKDKALAGRNTLHSTYGYMETEIFAELYEYQFDSATNPTDRPFDDKPKKPADVPAQLKRIKAAFAVDVAKGLVVGLARRVEIDPRITAAAKQRFKEAVKSVFGFEP